MTVLAKGRTSSETDRMLADRMAKLGIQAKDLIETFTRSSGPGGQHVNKTESAVEITHLPSGIVAVASDSRSQRTNRALALQRLVEKIEAARAAAIQARKAAASKQRRQRAKRSFGTKQEMLRDKRRRGDKKKLRGRVTT